jgi:hypothetical protein
MLLTTVIVMILCVGLRLLGFSLCDLNAISNEAVESDRTRRTVQFGMKHMLIWMTLTGPIVLIGREIDIGGALFPALLLAVSVATINLVAIWSVLGSGLWPIRLITLFLLPYAIGIGQESYSLHLKASLSRNIAPSLAASPLMADMADHWKMWMFFDAVLLAALLVFPRASGYRLMRIVRKKSAEH